MKKILLLACMIWAAVTASAGIPDGYYDNADGKYGATLKTALYGIISSHTSIGYDGVWTAFKTTDLRSDGKIWDIYSNITNYTYGTDQAGNYSGEGDCYNREHTFPQSWFKGASRSGQMKCDVFHLYPTDGYVNNRRSNYPFGEVSSTTYTSANSFSKLGSSSVSGYSGTVFEPNDEYKGDIARSLFYMVTCYQDVMSSCSSDMISSDTYPSLSSWAITMLLKWAEEDPVSEKEIARNEAIYALQGNRNPYIDYPGLEQYVWGDKKNVAVDLDNYSTSETTTVSAPAFTPEAGTYTTAQTVTIACATTGVTIYYTTDGSAPSATGGTKYTGAITVSETTTVKAVAIDGDGNKSSVATAVYTIGSTSTETGGETSSEYYFKETFDECDGTGGNDSKGFATGGSGTFTPDNDGWESSKSFGGYQCARFGSSSVTGTATTPQFTIPANTTATLTFLAAPWGTKDGTSLTLSVSGQATLGTSSFTMTAGQWTTFTTTLTNSTSSAQTVTLTFTPAKRMWLDDVFVTAPVASGITRTEAVTPAAGGYYNLSGVFVGADASRLAKGVYIKGGKKVVVK